MSTIITNRDGPGPAQLTITGEITDAMANEVVAELRTLSGRALAVAIDSHGGSYPGGVKIHNALRRHRGDVITYVGGLAASAASMIFMAGGRRVMHRDARLHIHDVSIVDVAITNVPAHKVAEAAVALAAKANDLAAVYADRAGGTIEEWRRRMIAETTFTAGQAVEWGLATAIDWSRREPVAAAVGPRQIWYLPQNRAGHARYDWWPSLFDPALHPKTPLDLSLYGLVTPRRRELDSLTARWIGTCIAHALATYPHPIGRALLARAARAN